MNRFLLFIAMSVLFLFSGCATLFSKKEDTITIKTEPPGAEVYVGVEPIGTTPLTYTFRRKTFEQKSLNIRKAGYKTKEMQLGRTLDATALFNFGFFLTTSGAPSWGIDALSGAMVQYDPQSYFIDLEPDKREAEPGEEDRRSRRAFVLFNHHRLKSDIARGGGEYLSAYHRMIESPEGYGLFLDRLRQDAADLISREEGVAFYEEMEKRKMADDRSEKSIEK